MIFENTTIKGLKKIKTEVFYDKRGFFKEIFKDKLFKKKFIFDVMSYSRKNVLRGLHIQLKAPQAKIVTVTSGKIMDVAVDLRKNSVTFGKYFSVIMSEKSNFSFYIPEGFAHGFLCLSKNCTVSYKCSKYREAKSEATLSWNDKSIAIKWPIKKPILSVKDKVGKNLNYFR